jgi:hypothetical protein
MTILLLSDAYQQSNYWIIEDLIYFGTCIKIVLFVFKYIVKKIKYPVTDPKA